MTASRELKLDPRVRSPIPPQDRGPVLRADVIAREVWQPRGLEVSAKWVIQKMAAEIGFKIGKAWYFYRGEAETWCDEWIAKCRRGEI